MSHLDMPPRTTDGRSDGPSAKRRSLLELAPLELDCMSALWPLGEATVREIRERLAGRCPRAYTTIMTIMDRLARKRIVGRHRKGKAWVYRPNLSEREARAHALAQVVENFFGGSSEALLAQIGSLPWSEIRASAPDREGISRRAEARQKMTAPVVDKKTVEPRLDATLL